MGLHPILEALGRIDAQHTGVTPTLHDFIKSGPWLIRRDRKSTLVKSVIPGLLQANKLKLLLKTRTALALSSTAYAIQVKENMGRIRAFYAERGQKEECLKIVTADDVFTPRINNEIKTRQTLESLQTIAIPRIIEQGSSGPFIFLREQFINGRRFLFWRDAAAYIDQGLPQLINTYRQFGVTAAPLKEYFPNTLPDDIGALVHGSPVGENLCNHMRTAWKTNPEIPASLCHGDLLPSNLAMVGKKLYFLDWDRSEKNAILFDLLRLPMKKPQADRGIFAATLKAVEQFGVREEVFFQYFCVYIAHRILQAPLQAPRLLSGWESFLRRR